MTASLLVSPTVGSGGAFFYQSRGCCDEGGADRDLSSRGSCADGFVVGVVAVRLGLCALRSALSRLALRPWGM